MSILSAKERGDMAEALLPVAAHLVTLVHGDGGPRDVHQALARLGPGEKDALLVVLAGLVDPDQPMGKALGWLDFNEHGQTVVPDWDSRSTVRDLVPEPELEDDGTYIDEAAVQGYVEGRAGEVSPRERLEAVKRGVRSGLKYPDFDRMHGLSEGSTSTFISRTRKAYKFLGMQFPDLMRPDAPGTAFTAEQVVAIRERYAAGGTTDMELSMSYGVARKTITDILSGDSHPTAGGPIRAKRKNRPSGASRTVWGGPIGKSARAAA